MRRSFSYALLAALALMVSADANAQSNGACCVFTTTKLDALLNPVAGGDEKFFTSTSTGVPNLRFVIDNSGSMFNWPFPLCPGASNNDCTCPELNNLGYDPTKTYAKELTQINSSSLSYWNNWFRNDRYYGVWPPRAVYNDYMAIDWNYGNPSNGDPRDLKAGTSSSAVCTGTSNPSRCQTCLDTRGYYFDTEPAAQKYIDDCNNGGCGPDPTDESTGAILQSKSIMSGNFLNYFAPKYLLTRKVVKEVIKDVRPIRMGIDTFWENGMSGVNGEPPTDMQNWSPDCDHPASNFDSNRQSFINTIDKLRFGGGTPLTRALVMAGWSYNYRADPMYEDAFGSGWEGTFGWGGGMLDTWREPSEARKKAVCNACSFNAILLFTDGEPNDWYEGAGNFGPDIPVPSCGASPSVCDQSHLDEAAKFLWNNDMRSDYPGKQRVATFTIAFGLDPNSPGAQILKSTADNGGGEYYSARNATELKAALLNVFDSINSRNTAFSTSNLASLQTGDTKLSAVVPRMRPDKNAPWSGLIYRFRLYNEFTDGAQHPQGNPDATTELFLTDLNNDIVVEEPDTGAFVKKIATNTIARPYWEASDRLQKRGHQNRNIFTVIDDQSPNGVFTEADSKIAFTSANAQQLLPYLGLSEPGLCPNVVTGDLGTIVTTIGASGGEIAAICGGNTSDGGSFPVLPDGGGIAMGQDEATLCCAKLMIEWVRGRSMGNFQDDGGSRTRGDVLGDIFHSSPVTVEAPAPRFLCDLGVSNQCVRTLYSSQLNDVTPTDIATATVTNSQCGTVKNANAYDKYVNDNLFRDRLVVVGANDGMLHAFYDGKATVATNDGGTICSEGLPRIAYDATAAASNGWQPGDEMWAFIPPDQLPRIHERILGHTYYVDGDIMVRDIWADGTGGASADGVKQPEEFHTMIVAAEGRGGNHYFSLEAKWDNNGHGATPDFRWIFPQPCSAESVNFGKTLFALAPKPPPIGPVLLGGSITNPGTTPTLNNNSSGTGTKLRYNVNTSERWIVMLSGGWSPFLEKGRGLYMVDAWSSQVSGRNDNLWWKAEYTPGATGTASPKANMTHSFAAPVALVDYGQDNQPKLDGFFDLAMAGDTRGQLWVARLSPPGTVTNGLISNWPIARAFEQDKGDTVSAFVTTGDVTTGTATRTKNQWPFYYLPSAALQTETGTLRAFIGAGNRYSILDEGPGVCRFDNPVACTKRAGCTNIRSIEFEDKFTNTAGANGNSNGAVAYSSVENHYAGGTDSVFAHANQTSMGGSTASFCGSGEVTARAGFTAREITCAASGTNMPLNNPPVPADLGLVDVQCGKFGVDGGFYCRQIDGGAPFTQDYQMPDASVLPGLGGERFYGMKVYGPTRFLSMNSADGGILDPQTFDTVRLTDRGAGSTLVDVTNVGCSKAGCDGGALASGDGWMLEYSSLDRKTAAGSVVLAGCVLWGNLYPAVASDGGCASSVGSKSEFFQADFITGQPNCAAGFLNSDGGYSRFKVRDVVAPPPEPSMAIMVGPNNEVRYSAMIIEPGQQQPMEINVAAGSDILQAVYELPISRALHNCRHTADGGCGEMP